MFYLFAGDRYYPAGGAADYITMDADLDVLREFAINLPESHPTFKGRENERDTDDDRRRPDEWCWWQIADDDMSVVEEGDYPRQSFAEKYPNSPLMAQATFSHLPPMTDTREHPLIEAQRDLGILPKKDEST